MLDKIFGHGQPVNEENSEHQRRLLQEHFDHIERMRELSHLQMGLIEKVERFLDEKELDKQSERQRPIRKADIFTINAGGTEIDSEDYLYAGIVAQDELDITITYHGFVWEVTLGKRITTLPLFDGMKLTPKNKSNNLVLLMLSDEQF